jgi:MoaA/NifB/PqqE/SkfB family radical SAM enzyme
MLLGFALTRHCNLRCPHCIRDDVTEVRAIPLPLLTRIIDEGRELFGDVVCSFTGGEPTIHPEWDGIIDALKERELQYKLVTNGWHMRRIMPSIDRHPPAAVRVSLSGASEAVHDAERGRGSFRRVQLAVALLTSRQVPTGLSIVIDKRDRHEIRAAADLAEDLGCNWISYILPQPVPGSADRDSDLAPADWYNVRDEVAALGRERDRRTAVLLDYGAPFAGEETACDTMQLKRIYIDPDARVSLCCQLSDYGFNTRDVTGDLTVASLHDVYGEYLRAMEELKSQSARGAGGTPTTIDAFPCLRCARSLGKLSWLEQFPESPWSVSTVSQEVSLTT